MFENCNCFVVKVTRDCNLRCKYCYIADKDKYKGEVMSFEVFKALVDRICLDKTKAKSPREFSFIFHGGEPTVVGYDNLNKFFHYAYHTFSQNHLSFNFSIQSNATLFTPKILGLFHDFGVSIGMSFDGSNHGSNTARTKKNIKEYLATAQNCRKIGINPGLLTVVSTKNVRYAKKNIKWLVKHNWTSGKWNYVEDVLNQGALEVPPEEYFTKVTLPLLQNFQKKRKKAFIEQNLNGLILNYFQAKLLNSYTLDRQNTRGNCYVKFCGGGARVLEISPDGAINYCGRYAKDDEISQCGHLMDLDFLGTQSRKMFYRHIQIKHQLILKNHCDLCSAADICDYGCLAFSYVKNKEYQIRTELVCQYFNLLKQYIIEHEDPLFEAYFNSQKNRNNVLYIRTNREVDRKLCNSIEQKIPQSKKYFYRVDPDPEFKSSDNKCYQVKITRIPKPLFQFNIWKRK